MSENYVHFADLSLPNSYIDSVGVKQDDGTVKPLRELLPQWEIERSIVLRSERDIKDLTEIAGGRAAKPRKPVVIYGPDGETPMILVGAGVTEAAELEEIALGAYEKAKKRVQQGKGVIDFEAFREQHGLPPKEKFDELYREALQERMRKHRQNHRTDPALQLSEKPKGNIF